MYGLHTLDAQRPRVPTAGPGKRSCRCPRVPLHPAATVKFQNGQCSTPFGITAYSTQCRRLKVCRSVQGFQSAPLTGVRGDQFFDQTLPGRVHKSVEAGVMLASAKTVLRWYPRGNCILAQPDRDVAAAPEATLVLPPVPDSVLLPVLAVDSARLRCDHDVTPPISMMDWTPPPPLACSLTPIHAPTPSARHELWFLQPTAARRIRVRMDSEDLPRIGQNRVRSGSRPSAGARRLLRQSWRPPLECLNGDA